MICQLAAASAAGAVFGVISALGITSNICCLPFALPGEVVLMVGGVNAVRSTGCGMSRPEVHFEWLVPANVACYALLAPSVPLMISRLRGRPRPGHCRRCGYDLTGNISGTCPECGMPRPPGDTG